MEEVVSAATSALKAISLLETGAAVPLSATDDAAQPSTTLATLVQRITHVTHVILAASTTLATRVLPRILAQQASLIQKTSQLTARLWPLRSL